MLDTEDRPIPGLYAAGEIVGGFFYFDSLRASGLMHGAVFGRIAGGQRRRELAEKLGLDSQQVERTIGEFNDAVQEGEFDPSRLDGKGTREVEPPKSNWALAIDTPPFSAYRVTGGITYTFGGLKAEDRHARAGVGHGGQADSRSLRCR